MPVQTRSQTLVARQLRELSDNIRRLRQITDDLDFVLGRRIEVVAESGGYSLRFNSETGANEMVYRRPRTVFRFRRIWKPVVQRGRVGRTGAVGRPRAVGGRKGVKKEGEGVVKREEAVVKTEEGVKSEEVKGEEMDEGAEIGVDMGAEMEGVSLDVVKQE
ncbi:hypothetical protein BDY21DRAFT_372388 [Lineolata rhizophorae]|uniref:Uncharacterized protein n=1 Tax=Lineolata rhizophorae TaxID=578093 RepID=A0A6A6NZJ3_9PEZI|nr:hypothetical protein BDY21DRAFT_372388 [Lineolata rhizophorae]